jgi:hypothetical protein
VESARYESAWSTSSTFFSPDTPVVMELGFEYGLRLQQLILCFLRRDVPRLKYLLGNYLRWRHLKDVLTHVRIDCIFANVLHLIVSYDPLPSLAPEAPAPPPIFAVGESHVLPLSWRKVLYRGAEHLLVPRLAQGCKAYHAGREARGREASILNRHVDSVPDGSVVLMVLGEIDCRDNEGICKAVDELKYPTVQAAVEATVRGYLDYVHGVALGRGIQFMLLTVRPPFPKDSARQREAVSCFNQTLINMVLDLNSPAVKVLDMTAAVMDPNTGITLPHYQLDDTHLNPRVVEHVLAFLTEEASRSSSVVIGAHAELGSAEVLAAVRGLPTATMSYAEADHQESIRARQAQQQQQQQQQERQQVQQVQQQPVQQQQQVQQQQVQQQQVQQVQQIPQLPYPPQQPFVAPFGLQGYNPAALPFLPLPQQQLFPLHHFPHHRHY